MTEDDLARLSRFYSDLIVPEMERIVDSRITPLRSELLSAIDGGYARIERLETEMTAVRGGMNRLEEKLASLEQRIAGIDRKLDQFALKSELVELEERVGEMQQRIDELKSMLNEH